MTRRYPSVAIVGAGMSGLCMAAMLRRSGITDITILEKSHEVGGTWRDNTYPGLSCDIPSRFYQFTFAPKPDWSKFFSPGGRLPTISGISPLPSISVVISGSAPRSPRRATTADAGGC